MRSIQVSGEEKSFDQIIVRLEGETPYIEADFVKQYTNMTYETLQEPDRILVTYKWGTIQQAKVKRDEDVRYQGGVKSPILTEVSKGDLVTVLEQLEKWTRVATADGYIGYVRNKKLGSVKETTISNEFTEPEYTRIREGLHHQSGMAPDQQYGFQLCTVYGYRIHDRRQYHLTDLVFCSQQGRNHFFSGRYELCGNRP